MVISTSSSPIIKCLSPHPPPPPPPFLPPIHPPPHLHPHPHPHPSNHSISPLRRLRRNSISVTPIPQHSLPIRILVADDSYVNCKLLAEFCIQLRVDVEFSANGQECYEKFMACQTIRQEKTNITWNGETTEIGTILTQPPTIILMDLDMPIMNGLICTERIRSYEQQHQLTKTPIISLSASTPNQHIDGMDASLWKPVSIHTLRDCIVTWAEHVHRLNMSGSTPSVIATAQDKTITATHCQVSSPIQALHVRTMTMTRSTPNIQRRLNNCNLDLIPSICMSSSYSSFHPPLSHSSLNSSSNSSSSSSSCCSCCSSPPSSSPSHRRDHNSCIEYSPTSSPLLPCTTFGKSNNSCNHESLTNQCTQQYHHPIARPDASHRHIQLLQRTYPSISESTPQARRSSISKIVRCATPYVFG